MPPCVEKACWKETGKTPAHMWRFSPHSLSFTSINKASSSTFAPALRAPASPAPASPPAFLRSSSQPHDAKHFVQIIFKFKSSKAHQTPSIVYWTQAAALTVKHSYMSDGRQWNLAVILIDR
ncbi:hypothetical protein Vafri_2723, partial [Volvox africanus]